MPAQVQPGDLFELRVVMERSAYGRFELKVPGHERLHRVAVEKVPVRLEDGVYRQQETWLLQADSSGELVIDGVIALLEKEQEFEEVKLPSLRVEVLPYAAKDASDEPLEFPEAEAMGSDLAYGLWIIGGVLLALGCWWWISRSNTTGVLETASGASRIGLEWEALLAGKPDRRSLERLMVERKWSAESHQELSEVVYGGRPISDSLVERLRKEVGR
ncbi:MAG: hypothetical protein WBG04_12925 [Haloferula sp.]